MPFAMLSFLLASSTAAGGATCDAKPFTLGTTHKAEVKVEPKPAPKMTEPSPPKPAQAAAHKPPAAGIAPCKDPKKG